MDCPLVNAVFAKHQHVSIVMVSLLALPLSSASTVSMVVAEKSCMYPLILAYKWCKYERNKGRNSKLSRPTALTLHRLRKTKLFFCHRLKKVFHLPTSTLVLLSSNTQFCIRCTLWPYEVQMLNENTEPNRPKAANVSRLLQRVMRNTRLSAGAWLQSLLYTACVLCSRRKQQFYHFPKASWWRNHYFCFSYNNSYNGATNASSVFVFQLYYLNISPLN